MGLSGHLVRVLTWPLRRALRSIASRPITLVGFLGTSGAFGHLAAWTASVGSRWPSALSEGHVTPAGLALATYAVTHPAYFLLAVVGLTLLAREE